ncbi:chemotaxis protein CheA [Clostridium putrefaciens]|uniref:Chemotaxis protein CheA n=1 Tax=Clostridium putrefaciens TaxID=99675 RepID=A0A381JAV7_9CLOT|nr:chemotaxis protein CheA [Clostridium putrefaciens]SUY47512.1 chemotaxis protein CheA [Clostridium putrefaciens]
MDLQQYLSMFLEESMDNLQILNESLLELEQNPDDTDKLNEIFRVAHTIKGMAATMGYNNIAELTHKMEDVLERFRQGELKVTERVVTVLFQCLDNLEKMVNNVSEGIGDEEDIEDIIDELESISKEHNEKTEYKIESKEVVEEYIEKDLIDLNEYDIGIIEKAQEKGFYAQKINVGLDKNTLLKSARVFLILQYLEEWGEVIKSFPSTEDIENENFDFEISLIYITTKSEQEVFSIISHISEVREIEVTKINLNKIKSISDDNYEKSQQNLTEIEEKELISSKHKINLNEYDINIIKQAEEKGFYAEEIHIVLDENTLLKSARAFLIFKALEEGGEVIKSVPSIEEIENENFDFEISLIYITNKNKEDTSHIIYNISEVRNVEVNKIELTSIGMKETEEANTIFIDEKEIEQIKTSKPNMKVQDLERVGGVTHKKNHQSIRVDLERLDKLMNMVSELVIHRTRLEQISSSNKSVELNETLEQIGRTTSDIQDLVMKIRMLPLDVVFNRFPRMIRDISLELDKDIEFVIEGQDTELDRTVIDEIGEPLIHLIRNAADHGIESREERRLKDKSSTGVITLSAYQEGTKAVIRVEDNGRGINIEKVRLKAEKLGISTDGMNENDIKNLVFLQGFSTNDKVTDISGRGVGMDVVKTKIGALGGTVEVISEIDKGSTFIIKLPLTLQIIQALLVKVGSETMAISLGYIDRVINYREDLIKRTNGEEVIIYRDNVIPLIRINELLEIDEKRKGGKGFIVITNVAEKSVGFLVDDLLGQQEIVIKPLGSIFHELKEYIGATILGDGLVTLILDVGALV